MDVLRKILIFALIEIMFHFWFLLMPAFIACLYNGILYAFKYFLGENETSKKEL